MAGEMVAAFGAPRKVLAKAAVLARLHIMAKIRVAVNASNHHVGGVLQQCDKGVWQLLAFFSRKLNQAESCYSTFDRKLLVCVAVLSHFWFLVKGWKFLHFDRSQASHTLTVKSVGQVGGATAAAPGLHGIIYFRYPPSSRRGQLASSAADMSGLGCHQMYITGVGNF